jgi:hypothetical protein
MKKPETVSAANVHACHQHHRRVMSKGETGIATIRMKIPTTVRSPIHLCSATSATPLRRQSLSLVDDLSKTQFPTA